MKRLWIAVHLETLWCAVLSLAPAMATQAVDPATAADAALGLGGEAKTAQAVDPATAAGGGAALGLGGEAKISVDAILAAVRVDKRSFGRGFERGP